MCSLVLTLISTTSAASIATSVPVPMAIPTSAMARAGESLTPSPTMATLLPARCSCSTLATLWEGRTSAKTFLMPTWNKSRSHTTHRFHLAETILISQSLWSTDAVTALCGHFGILQGGCLRCGMKCAFTLAFNAVTKRPFLPAEMVWVIGSWTIVKASWENLHLHSYAVEHYCYPINLHFNARCKWGHTGSQ